jgi:chaperonin GroES
MQQQHTLDDKVIRGPLQPVSNFILVSLRDTTSLTTGGIVLPDQSQDKPTEALVVAAGPGRYHPHTGTLIPMCVAPGDRVMYSKYAGKKVKYDGADHSLITDDDLLLVYDGEKVTADNLKMIRDQVRLAGRACACAVLLGVAAHGAVGLRQSNAGLWLKWRSGYGKACS